MINGAELVHDHRTLQLDMTKLGFVSMAINLGGSKAASKSVYALFTVGTKAVCAAWAVGFGLQRRSILPEIGTFLLMPSPGA